MNMITIAKRILVALTLSVLTSIVMILSDDAKYFSWHMIAIASLTLGVSAVANYRATKFMDGKLFMYGMALFAFCVGTLLSSKPPIPALIPLEILSTILVLVVISPVLIVQDSRYRKGVNCVGPTVTEK